MAVPVAGSDYPGSYAEMRAWFDDDEACLDYLDWLRWREGWSCPACAEGSTQAPLQPRESRSPGGQQAVASEFRLS